MGNETAKQASPKLESGGISVPPDHVLVRKVRGAHAGIHPAVGYTQTGYIHTMHVVQAARWAAHPLSEFEPVYPADIERIAAFIETEKPGQAAR